MEAAGGFEPPNRGFADRKTMLFGGRENIFFLFSMWFFVSQSFSRFPKVAPFLLHSCYPKTCFCFLEKTASVL